VKILTQTKFVEDVVWLTILTMGWCLAKTPIPGEICCAFARTLTRFMMRNMDGEFRGACAPKNETHTSLA
jgi:hypothetical protein